MTRLPSWRLNVSSQEMRLSERLMILCRFVFEISGRILKTLSCKLKSLQSSFEISSGLAPVKERNAQQGQKFRLRGSEHQFDRLERQDFDGLPRAFDLCH